jgi:predicted transcriptional regulator with HTH domain
MPSGNPEDATMTDGARCRSNQRLRKILYPMVKKMYPGTTFKSNELAKQVRSPYREINSQIIGAMLREMDEVRSLEHGVWERVPA